MIGSDSQGPLTVLPVTNPVRGNGMKPSPRNGDHVKPICKKADANTRVMIVGDHSAWAVA